MNEIIYTGGKELRLDEERVNRRFQEEIITLNRELGSQLRKIELEEEARKEKLTRQEQLRHMKLCTEVLLDQMREQKSRNSDTNDVSKYQRKKQVARKRMNQILVKKERFLEYNEKAPKLEAEKKIHFFKSHKNSLKGLLFRLQPS